MPNEFSPKEITERKDNIRKQLKAGFIPNPDNKDQIAWQTEALEFIAIALGELVEKMDRLESNIRSLQRAR